MNFAEQIEESAIVIAQTWPTNHFDFDAVDSLIVVLNDFERGLVVVSLGEYLKKRLLMVLATDGLP